MKLSPTLRDRLGPMDSGSVETDDNVRLDYQCFGNPDGPPVVFANGIGVRYPGAILQVEALRPDFRFICWDYRGLGDVKVADPNALDVSMGRHALDILTILDHLDVDKAAFFGWSMGVQVTLEVIRRQPERVVAFAALMGTFARPFRTGLPLPLALAAEQAFSFGLRYPRLAHKLVDAAFVVPHLPYHLFVGLGLMDRRSDREVFAANAENVHVADKTVYLRTMFALAAHDASELLPRVTCPTLVVPGARDRLTPPRVARRMADAMPNAEYREIAGGTHFALDEQPELLNTWLLELLERSCSR